MNYQRLLTIIHTTSILLIIMFVGLYISGLRCGAYAASVKFIQNNETFRDSIGELLTDRLAFLGYSVSFHGPNGKADYKICVTAKNGKGDVYLSLQKDTGVWSVIKANLVLGNGTTVKLL